MNPVITFLTYLLLSPPIHNFVFQVGSFFPFPIDTQYAFVIFLMHAPCPAHLIALDLIILMVSERARGGVVG
jgi:hypothetical protein